MKGRIKPASVTKQETKKESRVESVSYCSVTNYPRTQQFKTKIIIHFCCESLGFVGALVGPACVCLAGLVRLRNGGPTFNTV